jgi:2-phospho-L-lactate guanylyltransferase
MLADVLAAAVPVGRTLLAAPLGAREARRLAADLEVEVVDDTGQSQSEAVGQALRLLHDGPVIVVNADLPCVRPADLLALVGLLPAGGLALAEAADGTTNALALSSPRQFERLYGPGSADRFRRHAEGLGVQWADAQLPNLVDDVDTPADLRALAPRLGPATTAAVRRSLASAA